MLINEQELIKKLEAWLKENRVSTLADRLNYRSTGTIIAWVRKKRIPPHMQERVLAIISSQRKG